VEWVTTKQAVSIANCAKSTIRRKAREGYIERKKNGNYGYLYNKSDVEKLDIESYKGRW